MTKRNRKMPIPSLHLVMICVALIVLMLAMTFHYLQPQDTVWVGLVSTVVGFLFGKFTNGFRLPEDGVDTMDKESEEDGK